MPGQGLKLHVMEVQGKLKTMGLKVRRLIYTLKFQSREKLQPFRMIFTDSLEKSKMSITNSTVKGEGVRVEKRVPTDDERKVHVKNKFNPSSSEIQRQQMAELLKHPEREIVIPKPQKRTLSPPPELVSNIAGSSAGAGSGEFHVYKQARRKEFERMKIFEEEELKEQTEKDFALQKTLHDARDNAKTEKNRLKRLKRRGNKGKSDKPTTFPATSSVANTPESKADQEVVNTPEVPVAITEPKGIEIVEDDF